MERIDKIQTISSLKKDFEKLGITPGMTLMVHTSFSSVGLVCGNALALIQALQETLTNEGTLIMPTHSTDLSDPKDWYNPKVDRSLWSEMKKEMPGYNKLATPTYKMGRLPELFRTLPEVERSTHPAYSFSAWGKDKDFILEEQSLNNGLGEKSPLARIYDLNGHILLLGTQYDSNTSMHLSEHRIGVFPRITQASPIIVQGNKKWVTYDEIEYDEANFIKIGESFERKHAVKSGLIGEAPSKLMNQKDLVDYTTQNILQFS